MTNLGLQARIAVVGMNGSGKSTFIKTLAGELGALTGEVFRSGNFDIISTLDPPRHLVLDRPTRAV